MKLNNIIQDIKFEDIEVAEVFVHCLNAYMKLNVAHADGESANAVELSSGELTEFDPDDIVYRINAKLI